jgi:hypothetical protein
LNIFIRSLINPNIVMRRILIQPIIGKQYDKGRDTSGGSEAKDKHVLKGQ